MIIRVGNLRPYSELDVFSGTELRIDTMKRKEVLAFIAIGLAVFSFVGLSVLKLTFPLDPPLLALNILRASILFGLLSFCIGIFAFPSRKVLIVIVLLLVNTSFFLFGWPFYGVY